MRHITAQLIYIYIYMSDTWMKYKLISVSLQLETRKSNLWHHLMNNVWNIMNTITMSVHFMQEHRNCQDEYNREGIIFIGHIPLLPLLSQLPWMFMILRITIERDEFYSSICFFLATLFSIHSHSRTRAANRSFIAHGCVTCIPVIARLLRCSWADFAANFTGKLS